MLPRIWVPVLVGLALVPFPGRAEVPWTERDSCREAGAAGFAADVQEFEKKVAALERSADLDDQACALWARASYAEIHVAVFGNGPKELALRRKALTRLFQFGRAQHDKGTRFADLELEARLRRIRVLFGEGGKTDALRETKQLYELVERRESLPATPTFEYVRGVLNGALAAPGWAARALLTVAGLSSDLETAAKDLEKIAAGNSVYKWDAVFVSHHFAEEEPEKGAFKGSSVYSGILLERFPNNPQWALDHAGALQGLKRITEARATLSPALKVLETQPERWSTRIRTKLCWLGGRLALDAGDKSAAKRLLGQAKAQGWRGEGYGERIDELDEALGS